MAVGIGRNGHRFIHGSTSTAPASGSTAADVNRFLYGPLPSLRLPASYQWRVSLERSVGTGGVASMAYVGATGRNLLGNQAYIEPDTGILDRRVTLTENSSNYARLPEVVRNWTTSGVFHARSGFPIDVLDSE